MSPFFYLWCTSNFIKIQLKNTNYNRSPEWFTFGRLQIYFDFVNCCGKPFFFFSPYSNSYQEFLAVFSNCYLVIRCTGVITEPLDQFILNCKHESLINRRFILLKKKHLVVNWFSKVLCIFGILSSGIACAFQAKRHLALPDIEKNIRALLSLDLCQAPEIEGYINTEVYDGKTSSLMLKRSL